MLFKDLKHLGRGKRGEPKPYGTGDSADDSADDSAGNSRTDADAIADAIDESTEGSSGNSSAESIENDSEGLREVSEHATRSGAKMTNEVGKDGQGQSGSSSVGSTAEVNSTELPGDESMDDSEILEEYLDEQAGDDAQRPADQSYDAAPDDAESDDNYKIDQYREDYLRAIAELQNVKRRSEADVAKARKYGSESMARGLLDVKDSLDLARSVDLSDATEDSMKRMQEGLELTLRQLETVLEKHGVIEVSPKMGDKLDPSLHQAMSIQPSDAVKPNHVLAVVQKGYQLHDRLLRAAMVIVAKRADAAEPTTNVTDIDQDQAGADMKEGSPDE